MTMGYDNTNRGSLFKNDRKAKDTDRDYNGWVNIEGREYWLSGWKKQTKTGDTFLSLSVKPKEPRPATQPLPDEMNDEIPF